jgi:Mrp family chromosome partitioning ATPase
VLPEQLWSVLRRYRALAATLVVLSVVGFVLVAGKGQEPYHATMQLTVQLAGDTNSSNLEPYAENVQARLESDDLKRAARKDTASISGDIHVTATVEPNNGIVDLTVSSQEPTLVGPALTAYLSEIEKFPSTLAKTPTFSVQQLNPPQTPVQDSKKTKLVVAGLEGLVFGIALAVFASLGFARWRQSQDRLERLERHQGLRTLVALPEPTEPGAGREDEYVMLAAQVRSEVLAGRATSFAVAAPRASTTRSVVAAQLARSLAIAGHRVLLVDTDMRAPRLEAALAAVDASPTAPFTGLGWLPTEATSVPNLVILRGSALPRVIEHLGMHGSGPVRLVAGSIAALVAEARNAGVVLVVDCPAPDGAAEASAVISAVDSVLVVTSRAPRKAEGEKLTELTGLVTTLGTEITGVVAGPKRDYNLRVPVPTRSPV